MSFQDKVVIVTGSGAGIGREAAILFAKKGAKVVVNSVTPANGEETLRLIREAGGEGIYICADVSQESETKRIIDETMQTYGRIDVLVNNAGIVLGGTVDTTTLADYQRTMDVNVKSVLMLSLQVIPIMRAQGGGRIVNTGSVAGFVPIPFQTWYSASKAAQTNMMQSLSLQLAKDGITVNNVAPGVIYTDRNTAALSDPDYAQKVMDSIPVGFYGKPEDCAGMVRLLCSDA